VIIDGLDGSGKSTQANLLLKELKRQHRTVFLRIHPETDNWFGRKARVFLFSKGKGAHFASALFYMVDVIRSILLFSRRRVDYVILVRYLMGTAYLPSPLHIVGYLFFSALVPKSVYMYFLDATPEVAVARVKKRGETEMFETYAALKKIRVKALALTRFDKWLIVDSNQVIDEVAYVLGKVVD
jgi:dTMP kinase